MKRVLMLVPSLGMGGMERVCVNYANMMTAHGFEVHLYNLGFDNEAIISRLDAGVDYKKMLILKVPNIKNASFSKLIKGSFRLRTFDGWVRHTDPKKLYKQLITDDPDLFDLEIAFYGGQAIKILNGSCQRNSKKIGWIHASTIESHFHLFRDRNEADRSYRGMDALICVSNVVRDRAVALFGKDINAEVLYNPQDTERIMALKDEPVQDIEKTKTTFINASRLDINHKGFDRLANAVKKLNQEGFDFEVWILGDGKDKDRLTELLKSFKLCNIRMLGEKQNPYKYMQLADVYICSSRFEGYSMVVAEAIMLGLPVITTDVSGAREMLGDSEFGMVTQNSEDGIYRAMKDYLENEDTRKWMRQKASEHRDFLDSEKIFHRFSGILEKL